MFKKLLFILAIMQQVNAGNTVPVDYQKIAKGYSEESLKDLSPRQVYNLRKIQAKNICKLFPLESDASGKVLVFESQMTDPKEVSACFRAIQNMQKSFENLTQSDQQKIIYFKDNFLADINTAIFDHGRIAHKEIFKELYAEKLISKKQYDECIGLAEVEKK